MRWRNIHFLKEKVEGGQREESFLNIELSMLSNILIKPHCLKKYMCKNLMTQLFYGIYGIIEKKWIGTTGIKKFLLKRTTM